MSENSHQFLQVIFTRPVVALGEGFGTGLSDDKVKMQLLFMLQEEGTE